MIASQAAFLVGLSDMYANRVLKVLDYRKKQNSNTASPISEKIAEIASPPDTYLERHQLMQKQTRLSEDEIEIVIKEYTDGMNINQLAQKYHCHRTTISQHLKNHGVEIRDLSIPEHLIDKATDLYCSGLSYAKIGKQLGFDGETIRKKIKARMLNRL